MKFEIKNRWSGELIFSIETDSWRLAVEAAIGAKANFSGADFSGANLSGANLLKANLSKADFSGANLLKANLLGANFSKADLSGANLLGANLLKANFSKADFSGANLSGADLSKADFSGANLSGADLSIIKNDIWAMLLAIPHEVEGLRQALVDGKINGNSYEGDCACFVGTAAKLRKCKFDAIPSLKPNSDRPGERFFMGIKTGDTPKNNPVSKLAAQWIDEWQENMKAVFAK